MASEVDTRISIDDEMDATQTTELLDISVAADGTVVGVAPSGTLVRCDSNTRQWAAIAGDRPTLAQISVANSNELLGLDSAGAIHHVSLTDGSSQRIPGQLAHVSAAADGAVWGVGTAGEALRYTGDAGTWEAVSVPNPLQRLSVGSASNIVALDKNGKAYSYRGGDGWQALAGSFQEISVAQDGTIWAITATGDPSIYAGEPEGWLDLPGTALRHIAVGSTRNVWGLDRNSRAVDLTDSREPFGEKHITHRGPGDGIEAMWDAQDPFNASKSTHLWIVNRAAWLAANDPDPAGRQVFDLIKPDKQRIGDPFHDQLCQGLYDADYLDKYNGPRYLVSQSWAGHFYDPDTQQNWLGDSVNTARVNCRTFAASMSTGWAELDRNGHPRLVPPARRGPAGYNLGLALHYLTDSTQPMHAFNFCWQNSHPTFGYHSRVEEYVMTQHSRVQLPVYTPPANGPFGLTCPQRAAHTCECTSACGDLGLYVHAAATNAKKKYFYQLRDVADSDYWGWPGGNDYWKKVVNPLVSPMLRDAIVVTAQFLVAWMQFAKRLVAYFEYDSNWTNVVGYLTSVSAGADGTVWGVNALQTPEENNVYEWDAKAGTWRGINQGQHYLTSIAVKSKSEIWGINARLPGNQNNVFQWTGTTWKVIPGYLTQITVASDGTVWGVNDQIPLNMKSTSNIFKWNGSSWESFNHWATQVAVVPDSGIWAINSRLENTGSNIVCYTNGGWKKIPGYLTQIAAAPDGTIFGVNGQQFSDAHNVYAWTGQAWRGIPGYLTHISPTSKSTFWGVNTERSRYDIVNAKNIYSYKEPSV